MLNKDILADQLKAAFTARITSPTPQQQLELNELANDMATAIDNFVKTTTVTYLSGLVADTTTGVVTGTFVHSIS